MQDIKLSSIYIYPIKSLKGIDLTEAKVEERGFRYDRRWMLVGPDGKMITQRQCPRMATISVYIASDGFRVVAPGTEALDLPFNIANNQKIQATIWEDLCEATLVGKFADDWFSRYLKMPCRLVYMPELTKRFANPNYNVKNSIVSFADGFQF